MRRRGEMVRLLIITLVLWFTSVSSGFALGTISGTVFGPGGGPLTGVDLEVHLFTSSDVCTENHYVQGATVSQSTGTYSLTNIDPGTYYLKTWPASPNYTIEYWAGGSTSSVYCNDAQSITINNDSIETVSFDIVEGGSISGTVRNESGTPLVSVPIHVNVHTATGPCDYLTHVAGSGDINTDGTYSIDRIPPGDYYLNTWHNDTGYIDEFWDGTNSDPDCNNAQLITVTAGETESNKDFYLQEGAIISGNVAGNYGDDVCISAYIPNNQDPCDYGEHVGGAGPDNNGDYSFVVPPGEYYLEFDPACGSNPNNLLLEYWTSNSNGTLDCAQMDTISVQEADQVTANITLDEPGAIISGYVDDGNGNPVSNLSLMASPAGCNWGKHYTTRTDSSGNYSLVVPEGDYKVDLCPGCDRNSNYSYVVSEYWDGGTGSTDCDDAGTLSPTIAQEESGIDFVVEYGGIVNGFVFEDGNSTPLTDESGVRVDAVSGDPCNGTFVGGGSVDFNDGSYTTDAFPVGNVYLKVNHAEKHPNVWWTTTGTTDDCNMASPVQIVANTTVTDKNFIILKDSDGDDLSDIDEATYGLDETKKDSDGDGLEDSVEVYLFTEYYSIPFGGDLDGDLIRNIDDDDIDGDNASDLQELARGSNPADAGSVPAALLLYDDFSSPTLNSEKWFAEQYAMEVEGGNLRLFADSSAYRKQTARMVINNDLKFKSTFTLSSLEKYTSDDSALYYRIATMPYNTGTNPDVTTGQVFSSLYIGDRGNGLEVWYYILRAINDDWDDEVIDTGVVVAPNTGLSLNTKYQLEIIYDGVDQFTYSVYDQNGARIGAPSTASGPTFGTQVGSYKQMRVKVPSTGGKIDVTVFQVESGDDSYTIYDDFTRTSLDPAKWTVPEVVKELDGGKMKILAHTFGDNRYTTSFEFAQYYPYVEAELIVDSTSWQSSARGQSQLAYVSMYNESRGPGSGQSYNGLEGDWEAIVMVNRNANETNPFAYTWMARYPGPTWDDYDTLVWEPFDLSITTSTTYRLFIGFAGDFIVTGLENLTTGEIDADIEPGSATQYPPANLFTALRSRIYGGEGEAKHLSYFDNVYVSGDPLFTRGDVNVDGNVDLQDAIESIRAMTGSNGNPVWFHGDMNNDGAIGIPEAIGVLNYLSTE